MKRAFYNALDALWMLRNHGMTFVFDDGEMAEVIDFEYSMTKNDDERFYPDPADPAGLALLAPRVGDYVKVYGKIIEVVSDYYEDYGVTGVSEAKESKLRVIQRNNIPFIMPQWEDAE